MSMETIDNKPDDDLRRVYQTIDDLSEFFDTVQIFVTRYESADIGTVSVQKGVGNWYARRGQIQEWLLKSNEDARCEARKADNE